MSRGASPWSDPAVETGFAAAYAPYPPVQERRHVGVELAARSEDADGMDGGRPGAEGTGAEGAGADGTGADAAALHDEDVRGGDAAPVPTLQDDLDEAADAAARPLTSSGRRARAPRPGRLSPARAVAGAAVSVSGVLLGIGTLLWVSDDPSRGPGPVVQQGPVEVEDPADAFATRPEGETAPVDPVEVPAPAPAEPPTAAAPAPAAPAPPPAAAPAAPSVVVPVTVLNNSRRTGLAERAAARFRAQGWPVAQTGNFRGRIRATTVYYAPGQEASARAFARRFEGIARVLPRFDGLPGSGLTVVLTRDFG